RLSQPRWRPGAPRHPRQRQQAHRIGEDLEELQGPLSVSPAGFQRARQRAKITIASARNPCPSVMFSTNPCTLMVDKYAPASPAQAAPTRIARNFRRFTATPAASAAWGASPMAVSSKPLLVRFR